MYQLTLFSLPLEENLIIESSWVLCSGDDHAPWNLQYCQ